MLVSGTAECSFRHVQQLLPALQACGEVYGKFAARLPQESLVALLDLLQGITQNARKPNLSVSTRAILAMAQEREQVRLCQCGRC